jgi:hypothetical protein
MRTLAFSLLMALAGCAAMDRPEALSGAQIVALAREGKTAPEIIAELQRTGTVLALQASDFVRLHEAGVPEEVLDYLQNVQIEEMLWRERSSYWGTYYRNGPWLDMPPRRYRSH